MRDLLTVVPDAPTVRFVAELASPERGREVRRHMAAARLGGGRPLHEAFAGWDGEVWVVVRVQGTCRTEFCVAFSEESAMEMAADLSGDLCEASTPALSPDPVSLAAFRALRGGDGSC